MNSYLSNGTLAVVINNFQDRTPLSAIGKQEFVANVRGQIQKRVQREVPIFLFDAKAALEGDETAKQSVSEFTEKLNLLINSSGALSKAEKARNVLIRELSNASREVESALSLRGKSGEEVARLQEKLRSEEIRLKPKVYSTIRDLTADVDDVKATLVSNLRERFSAILTDFLSKLRSSSDLGGVQSLIKDAEMMLYPQMERAYLEECRSAKNDLNAAVDKADKAIQPTVKEIRSVFSPTGVPKKPGLANLPPGILTILDYLLMVFASPLPLVFDVVGRMIIERIPQLKALMPTGIVQNILVSAFEAGLRNEFRKALDQVERTLESTFSEILSEIQRSGDTLLEDELRPYRQSIEKFKSSQPTKHWEMLATIHPEIESIVAEAESLKFQ